jgi:hypothetical protein
MPARIVLGSRSSGFRLGERLTSSSSWALGRARRNRSARSDHHSLARFRGYEDGSGEPVRPEAGECSELQMGKTQATHRCAWLARPLDQTKPNICLQCNPVGLGLGESDLFVICFLFPCD